VLEERIAALEGGTAALAVASGHAAQVVVFQQLMMPGDEIVAARKLYGGSINQFTTRSRVWLERGLGRSRRRRQLRACGDAAHQGDLHRIDRQSPPGSVTDIEAIAAVARKPACR